MIYLATPYWHATQVIREHRVKQALLLSRHFLRNSNPVFSPIAYQASINSHFADSPVPLSNDEWVTLDLAFLRHSTELYVAQIDGWLTSRGVEREILFARSVGIPIQFMPEDWCEGVFKSETRLSVGSKFNG